MCERTIAADLEYLISKAVDPAKADYAVITGTALPPSNLPTEAFLLQSLPVHNGKQQADT